MNVILVKEVSNLGNPGDVVRVKNGYARNFLLPQKLAVRETPDSLAILEKQKGEFEKQISAKRAEYEAILSKIRDIKDLKIKVKTGEDGKLFGTVTTQNLSEALTGLGIALDRKQVILKEHVKHLGTYTARVQLAKDFKADISFEVVQTA
ncbi:MAG: 50S ribosomal protein L9 [Spirochaetia bacterium]|nr:50S ribosomal protein L9 [Spirochaetia bacterium]